MRFALQLTSLSLILTLGLTGCDGGSAGPSTAESTPPSDPTPAPAEPVLEDVLARSKARWDAIVDADWIQAYDYLTPARKKQESLAMFLRSKDHHEYKNPSVPRLLGGEQGEAFVEISVLWTPHHPILEDADNNPGDLTQQLDVVETWQWSEGEWFWVELDRQKDFLLKHPNLGR